MKSFIKFTKIITSKKNQYNNGIYTPELININKPQEERLSESIKIGKNGLIFQDNENSIYEILITIKSFKEFISLNNFGKETVLNMIKSGILKIYNKDEKIFKKGAYPEYYFLVLVGEVSYINQTKIYKSGNCFGDEIVRDAQYKQSAIALKDKTILLLLTKMFFRKHLLDNIINTNEKITNSLAKNFEAFKTLDSELFQKYKERMIKLFPFTGQLIVSKEEIANAIFIIYRGNCSLNLEDNKDLMVLSEDDIFGTESLANIDTKMNLKNNNYLYNIINKSPDTIIFKFFINDLHISIINALKEQLASKFLERKDIIQNHENMKEILKSKLIKKYNFLKKEKKMNELIKAASKELSIDKAETLYNKFFHKTIAQQKYDKNKKKILIPKRSCLSIKKSLLNLIKKSKSSRNYLEENMDSIDNDRKKLMTNLFLKKNIKDINKVILNSGLKKWIKITDKEKEQINDNKSLNFRNKNKKNQKSANSSATYNKSKNSYRKNVFFTTVDLKSKDKFKSLYKKISIKSEKDKSNKHTRKVIKINNKDEHSIYKDDASKTIIGSTFRDTISYRNKSHLMPSKNQIEIYGCNVIDTINYFNYGEKEKLMIANNYDNIKKNENYKNVIFYETYKYNIPLFVLFDEKERIKLPEISVIKKSLNVNVSDI